MFVLVGFLIVLGSVLGGYAIVQGNFAILLQPAELLIIFGAGFGAFIASNSAFTLKLSAKGMGHMLANGPSKNQDLEMLALLYGLFAKMQREGIISVEKDIEQAKKWHQEAAKIQQIINGVNQR